MAVRFVDLAQPFFNGMPYNWWIVGVPRPEITTIIEADEGGLGAGKTGMQKFVTTTHIGTHIDAQSHIVKGGKSIDQYPLERFYGSAVCWDVSHVGRLGLVTPDVLEKCEPKPRDGDIAVLLHTGYGKYFMTNYHLY